MANDGRRAREAMLTAAALVRAYGKRDHDGLHELIRGLDTDERDAVMFALAGTAWSCLDVQRQLGGLPNDVGLDMLIANVSAVP